MAADRDISSAASRRLGFSWSLRSPDWGIWFDRVNAPAQIAWRFNIGPLHIVRLR